MNETISHQLVTHLPHGELLRPLIERLETETGGQITALVSTGVINVLKNGDYFLYVDFNLKLNFDPSTSSGEATNLGLYEYQLFSIVWPPLGLRRFPLQLFIDESVLDEIAPGKMGFLDIENAAQLAEALDRIMNAQTTKTLIEGIKAL